MHRILFFFLLGASCALAEKSEPAPLDAPYEKVFDPWRACTAAEGLAKRGAPDALRTCFLAAYVRLSQPFLGGEDLEAIHRIFQEVLPAVGDKNFASALEKQRPEIRSAAAHFLSGFFKIRDFPKTHKLLRAAPQIDWPLDRAYRNDR
ncbi:MAG TPA: hypothetical protein VJU77_12770 [Chthoniobacterales bacterium]|nr:hypothetical protein [Chthoniobacterales bacterium]